VIKTIKNPLKNKALSIALSVVGMASLMAFQPAHAAKFGVKIINEAGQPVAGAAVCLGLPGDYKQFGALITDKDGLAMADIPNVPLVVTVSKTRFSGIRMNEPARGFNLVKEVVLTEGVPGPRCNAGSSMANNDAIRIGNVLVTEGAFSTTLEPMVVGEATQYRVSSSSTFAGADWQRFESAISLPSSLAEKPAVYLQLRKYQGNRKAWIEARSDVVAVELPVFQ